MENQPQPVAEKELPPTIASIKRDSLPPALAMMVTYCESAPWPAVEEEFLRQFPVDLPEGAQLDQTQARAKLAGLVLGAVLGVTQVPAPEGVKFPALKQAMELFRMTTQERTKLLRARKEQRAKRERKRKERRARQKSRR